MMYSATICLLAAILGVSGFGVRLDPAQIQARHSSELRVRCAAQPAQPIAACQFRVWFAAERDQSVQFNVSASELGTTEVLGMTPGPLGGEYTAHLTGGDSRFEAGFCELALRDVDGDQLLIGCKLTTPSLLSAIETMPAFLYKDKPLALVEHNETLFARPGSSVRVTLLTNDNATSLAECTAAIGSNRTVSGVVRIFATEATLPGSPQHTAHSGSECESTIDEVTAEDNGVFFVLAQGKDGSVGAKAVTLVVASPLRLVLTVSKEALSYDVGDVVVATCMARGVRPAATRWSWWRVDAAGGELEEITPAGGQDHHVEGWSWPWQDAVVWQSLTLNLTQEDHMKKLFCQVEDAFRSNRYFVSNQKIIRIKNDEDIGKYSWLIFGVVTTVAALVIVISCLDDARLKKLVCMKDSVSTDVPVQLTKRTLPA